MENQLQYHRRKNSSGKHQQEKHNQKDITESEKHNR